MKEEDIWNGESRGPNGSEVTKEEDHQIIWNREEDHQIWSEEGNQLIEPRIIVLYKEEEDPLDHLGSKKKRTIRWSEIVLYKERRGGNHLIMGEEEPGTIVLRREGNHLG